MIEPFSICDLRAWYSARDILSPALMRSDDSQPELKLSGFRFFDRHYIFFFARSAAS